MRFNISVSRVHGYCPHWLINSFHVTRPWHGGAAHVGGGGGVAQPGPVQGSSGTPGLKRVALSTPPVPEVMPNEFVGPSGGVTDPCDEQADTMDTLPTVLSILIALESTSVASKVPSPLVSKVMRGSWAPVPKPTPNKKLVPPTKQESVEGCSVENSTRPQDSTGCAVSRSPVFNGLLKSMNQPLTAFQSRLYELLARNSLVVMVGVMLVGVALTTGLVAGKGGIKLA